MPEDKDNFFERMLQRRPSHGAESARRASDASDRERPEGLHLERPSSHNESLVESVQATTQTQTQAEAEGTGSGPQMLRRQRRSSRLQRFKDYMRSEQEFDEVGDMYAKLL